MRKLIYKGKKEIRRERKIKRRSKHTFCIRCDYCGSIFIYQREDIKANYNYPAYVVKCPHCNMFVRTKHKSR